MAGQDIFISRREQLAGKMGRGVGLFLGNVESPRDYAMNTYEFSQDSTFRYFFGMDRPGLVGVIDFEKNITYISGRDYEIKDFVLLGKQSTIGEEASKFGIENFIPAGEFQNWFNTLLGERELFFIKPHRSENLLRLGEITGKSLKEIKEYYSEEFLRAIIDLRNFKSREEIREMERAT
ncbi:MAG: aminopeptidase P N-terminal domain-containing protein, partial [Fusobacteriaceae bacterium]